MKLLIERIANLIKVKSLISLLLIVVFCVLALSGVMTHEDVKEIVTIVVTFYFATQAMKNE